MGMAADAREGLRAAVQHDPEAARRLLDLLLTAPQAVRRKPGDRYGLLALMLGCRPRLLPADLARCQIFHRRWMAREFETHDIAAELFTALREIGEAPTTEHILAVAGGTWRVVRPRKGG